MRLIDGNALQIEMMDRGVDHIQTDDLAEINQIIDDAPTIDAVVIPGSVTNGDMIKALFPYIEPKFYTNLSGMYTVDIKLNDKVYGDVYNTPTFSVDWWNAPYEEGKE